MKECKIRIASVQDAEGLLKIYAPYVEKTAITFEYEVPTVAEFENRISRILERYLYLAAERDGELVGYAYAGPFKERAAYDWAVETTVYVRKDQKRTGIGRELYEMLGEHGDDPEEVRAFPEIRELAEEQFGLGDRSNDTRSEKR